MSVVDYFTNLFIFDILDGDLCGELLRGGFYDFLTHTA